MITATANAAKAQALDKVVPQLSSINNKAVTLRWNSPEATDGIFEDFEGHSDFVINSPGTTGWTYIDADNAKTYTWTAASFPNQGQKMAFIVFNPSKTSPSTGTYPAVQPFSGKKMLVDFTVDGGNNDFIISPALNFKSDFQISFRAKSYKDTWGLERFKVGYSTTGTRPSDFTFVQEGDYTEAPLDWTLFEYRIPKEAKYVCINCVSNNAFMFMLDDIFIGTNQVRPRVAARATSTDARLAGFNLYRDGEKVNTELIKAVYATDNVPDYRTYSYTVQPVMTDNTVGDMSEALSVEVPDVRLLPFFDDFDDNTIDSTRWSRPTTKAGEENKWKSDYYAYGLVDFSACYPYSSMADYSQSLVTRELNTPNPDNTWIRYEVRLDYNLKYAVSGLYSVLATEISTDGGNTWTKVDSIKNDTGSFNWRTYEFPLNKYLANNHLFKIRFRAYGNDARYVNYWFVDDVKIWNPTTHAATIKTLNAGQPVANCVVKMTADNGASYTETSDTNGNISLPRMEEGTYTVTAEAAGYNFLTTEWKLDANSGTTFTANLTRPVLNISEQTINQQSALEALTQKTITIENTGDGDLQYNFIPTPKPQSGTTEHRWDVTQAFDASGDMQSSVTFDGENFYTSSNFFLGKFFKYDREGHFLEEFSVPGMYYAVNDLTFDGKYFYGSDRKNRIFELDLRNKRLVSTIDIPSEPDLCVTHIAHDPRTDEFWVGDYNTLGRVNRKGEVTLDFYKLNNLVSMDVFGTAFDNVTPGGPYLWMSDLVTSGLNTVDKVTIKQYDLNNRRVVAEEHSAIDIPGYKTGSLSTGENNLVGIDCTTALVNGKLSLVGILQQSPSRIFAYTLADIDPWVKVSPLVGTLKAGEKQTITLDFDARSAQLNEQNSTTLAFNSIPTLAGNHDISLNLTATEASAYPRPVQLTATAEGESSATLAWQAAAGAQPTGYAIYRNDVKVGETANTTFTDTKLVRGTYAYAVQALYGDNASTLSDTANVQVKVGEPYFAPNNLTANITLNKHVTLKWEDPSSLLTKSKMIRFDEGKSDDAVGVTEGGFFYAGIALDADDLTPYRVIHTQEGYTLLVAALQEGTGTRYFYFDLGSVKGLSGYNIYRNGTKLNDAPLAQRAYADLENTPGTYAYEIETVYIDGTVSERTAPVSVTITEAGQGDVASDVKARAASYGYDVNVTMIDPTTLVADTYESFEDQTVGKAFSQMGWTNKDGLFKVTTDDAVQGDKALCAAAEDKAELIIPVGKEYAAPFAFSFMARNGLTSEGNGEIQVLSSNDGTEAADFINRGRFSTTEAWQQFSLTLPAESKYVILRVNTSHAAQYIDAISIHTDKLGDIYGYDIYRDGTKLNDEPVAGPNYTDHNLLPGTYKYQVVAYYNSSAISELSEPAIANVNYTNGYQQPGTLSVVQSDKGNELTWSVPALGDATELRWHNGVCDNAAGLPSGGQYYAGVEFGTDDLKGYDALSVSEVKFYINQVPDVLYVQLYEDKDLVFEKYATDLRQYAFNTVRLDKPFKVDASKKLRAVVYVEHNSITVPLGYDAGPAKGGKGNLYSTDGTTWTTLSDNDIEGNWNISIMLQPYADNVKAAPTAHLNATAERYAAAQPATAKAETLKGVALDATQPASFFAGYNIYCNGERINATPLGTDATTYLDAETHAGRYYEYQVKAIYPDYGEVGSNVVRVMTTGINNVTIDAAADKAPIYNLKGIRTDRTERGPVIQNGKKRLQK